MQPIKPVALWSGLLEVPTSGKIEVPFDEVDLDQPDGLTALKAAFERRHEALYTYSLKDQDPVLVNARVATTGKLPMVDEAQAPVSSAPAEAISQRDVYLGQWASVPVFDFAALQPGQGLAGPAVVESETTTVLLRDGDSATVTAQGWLDIAVPVASAS